MNRDGKEENPASIQCLTMLLRCLQDSSTVPLRLMSAALRLTPMELRMLKNAHNAVTIRYGATTVQAGSGHNSVKISYECAEFSSFHVTGESGCQ